jgi:hypothetical protein
MAQFPRDFPYLSSIAYDITKTYNTGVIVYYNDGNFYQSIQSANTGHAPGGSPNLWWTPYLAGNVLNYVQDADITNAFNQAQMNFNTGLWGTDSDAVLAYLFLTAYYLCVDFKNALAGLSSQSGAGIMTGRSVGSISESYTVPQSYMEDAVLAAYTVNGYGMKYLTLAMPRIRGNAAAVCGGPRP